MKPRTGWAGRSVEEGEEGDRILGGLPEGMCGSCGARVEQVRRCKGYMRCYVETALGSGRLAALERGSQVVI